MAEPLQKDSAILIIGAGTWGTSIAFQLAKRGYNNITVLDSFEFPSSVAAGNDVNKILEEGVTIHLPAFRVY
jgi:sarcosine oxidase / L-pipecolate oxidase